MNAEQSDTETTSSRFFPRDDTRAPFTENTSHNIRLLFLDADQFYDSYKKTRHGNLRCFPHCCEPHKCRSFCGVAVRVSMEDSTGVSLQDTVLIAWFRNVNYDRGWHVGERLDPSVFRPGAAHGYFLACAAGFSDALRTKIVYEFEVSRKWSYHHRTLGPSPLCPVGGSRVIVSSASGSSCTTSREDVEPPLVEERTSRESSQEAHQRSEKQSSEESRSDSSSALPTTTMHSSLGDPLLVDVDTLDSKPSTSRGGISTVESNQGEFIGCATEPHTFSVTLVNTKTGEVSAILHSKEFLIVPAWKKDEASFEPRPPKKPREEVQLVALSSSSPRASPPQPGSGNVHLASAVPSTTLPPLFPLQLQVLQHLHYSQASFFNPGRVFANSIALPSPIPPIGGYMSLPPLTVMYHHQPHYLPNITGGYSLPTTALTAANPPGLPLSAIDMTTPSEARTTQKRRKCERETRRRNDIDELFSRLDVVLGTDGASHVEVLEEAKRRLHMG